MRALTAMTATLALSLTGCAWTQVVTVPDGASTITASVETDSVASRGDAADDPAIWIHPTDASASRILGTDKDAGLHLYALDGSELDFLPLGRLNNVDLRQGVRLGTDTLDLAAATNRSDASITVMQIDRMDGTTRRLGSFPSGWEEPYGLCMGTGARGEPLVFANNKLGEVRKWQLLPSDNGVSARLLGSAQFDSQLEGCVYDDETSVLYLGEEGRGLWRMLWPAAAPEPAALIDTVESGSGLTADVEGVALYREPDCGGYLLVSSQGSNSYMVYERCGNNRQLGHFAVVDDEANGIDGTSETDGIDATSIPLGPRFPNGLLVVQDGHNTPDGLQNFKLIDWRNIQMTLQAAP